MYGPFLSLSPSAFGPVARRLRLLLRCSPALAASPPLERSGSRRLRLSLSPALARSLGFASLAAPPRPALPGSARVPSVSRVLSVLDRRRARRSCRRCCAPRVRCARVVGVARSIAAAASLSPPRRVSPPPLGGCLAAPPSGHPPNGFAVERFPIVAGGKPALGGASSPSARPAAAAPPPMRRLALRRFAAAVLLTPLAPASPPLVARRGGSSAPPRLGLRPARYRLRLPLAVLALAVRPPPPAAPRCSSAPRHSPPPAAAPGARVDSAAFAP